MDAYIANINGGRFGARVSGFDEALWKVCPAARKADGDRYGVSFRQHIRAFLAHLSYY